MDVDSGRDLPTFRLASENQGEAKRERWCRQVFDDYLRGSRDTELYQGVVHCVRGHSWERCWLHHGDEIQWHCLVFNARNIPRKPGLVWHPSNISPNHLLQLSYINCWNAKPGSLWGSGRQIAQQSAMTAESRLKRKFKSCSCDTTWDSEIFWL